VTPLHKVIYLTASLSVKLQA